MNSEFQYVHETAVVRTSEEWVICCNESSTRPGHALLDLDHPEAVLEGPGGVPVGDAADDLIREQEAEPDRQLHAEVAPAAWEVAVPDRDNGSGHAGISAKLIPATAAADSNVPDGAGAAQPPMKDISTLGRSAVSAVRSSE